MLATNKTAHLISLPTGLALVPGEDFEVPDSDVESLKQNPIIKLYLGAGLVEFKQGSAQQSPEDKQVTPVLENQQPAIATAQRLPVFDKAKLEEMPTLGTKSAEKVLANQPENGYASIEEMEVLNKDISTIDWAKVRAFLQK